MVRWLFRDLGIARGSEDEAWVAVGDAAEVEAGGPARITDRK